MADKGSGNAKIKTDEKKQHFDDIYVERNPVAFKKRIIDALDYVSDDFNRDTFDRLILLWCESATAEGRRLNYVDLCCCFGNTSMAIAHGMSVTDIRNNWKDRESCRKIDQPRRIKAMTTGIDISENALAYGKNAGIFDHTLAADLNNPPPEVQQQIETTLQQADIIISTASLVYLDLSTIETALKAFASGDGTGYMLVNFLNPFSLEKSDATKRLLLQYLEFVGSTATRHRRLSPLEQENYPGEDWALLEIWVLKRTA